MVILFGHDPIPAAVYVAALIPVGVIVAVVAPPIVLAVVFSHLVDRHPVQATALLSSVGTLAWHVAL